MINEATVGKARLYPELLPDSRVVSATAGFEVSPPILDLRRFGKFLHLVNVSVERTANAEIRVKNDGNRDEVSCAGQPDQVPNEKWNVLAKDYLYYNLYAASDISDFRTTFGLWVYEPTVAHKLRYNKPLTPEEAALARKLGLQETVEKGLLPLPLPYILDREYQLVERKCYVYQGAVGTAESIIHILAPKIGEFLVLEGVAASPGLAADNVRIRIDRDDNADYLELPTYPLSLDWDLKCFVPALHEFKIKVVAAGSTTTTVRYTIGRYVLTNLLKVRFGLLSKDEAPGDLWEKVKGGVL
jgi:hypothetical protein